MAIREHLIETIKSLPKEEKQITNNQSPVPAYCHILTIERLADSVIGRGTEVVKQEQGFKALSLFIGDDAKVEPRDLARKIAQLIIASSQMLQG